MARTQPTEDLPRDHHLSHLDEGFDRLIGGHNGSPLNGHRGYSSDRTDEADAAPVGGAHIGSGFGHDVDAPVTGAEGMGGRQEGRLNGSGQGPQPRAGGEDDGEELHDCKCGALRGPGSLVLARCGGWVLPWGPRVRTPLTIA